MRFNSNMICKFCLILVIVYLDCSKCSHHWALQYDPILNSMAPFSVHMTEVRKCRGVKHTGCDGVQYSATMVSPVALDVDIQFQREMTPLEAKIVWKGGMFAETHTIKTTSVCHDMFMRQILEHILPVGQCHLPAGRYKGRININETAHFTFDSRTTFPGTYVVKSSFYTNHCNVFCLLVDLVFTKSPHHRLASMYK